MMNRPRILDSLIIALLFLLPLLMFWPQTLGGRTLLPTENLYQFEPYASARGELGVSETPHNALISDLVLQNMHWKGLIRENLLAGEFPLWNPYQFSGIPFMAAGQQSTLYPFSVLYYVLPLSVAYGWFTVIQLGLAGSFMYLFLRGLGAGCFGGAIAGVSYQLAAFFLISAVFPMIIGAAAWLPLLLLMIECIVRQRPFLGRASSLPWVVIGAVALGCNILAGHVEITYYTLLMMGFYAAGRLLGLIIGRTAWREVFMRAVWLLALVVIGLGLGAAQFIPLFELASQNFRSGSAHYEEVIGWAHPIRDVVQFIMPNFYGNPTHHHYFDLFTGQTVPVTQNLHGQAIDKIDWGIKNYVEGALYVGILPLLLAAYALFQAVRRRSAFHFSSTVLIFTVLALLGLSFMFGLPTYRLLYALPGIDQLHSPFRWIFAVTVSVAVLAGLGADALAREGRNRQLFARLSWVSGGVILSGLALSRVFYAQLEPLILQLIQRLALADYAFADAQTFYSYQFTNVLILGGVLIGAGLAFGGIGQPGRKGLIWQGFAVGLVAVDLMIASWGFNPASDPALLDYTPPSIAWLQENAGSDWRYITVDAPELGERGKIMNANIGWRYGLYDVRGYESIIPRAYVDYMEQVIPQRQLDYNRVAPLFPDQLDSVDWERLAYLNVRYVVTLPDFPFDDHQPTAEAVYTDAAVRIWQIEALPRYSFFTAPDESPLSFEDNVRVLTDGLVTPIYDTGREKYLDVQTPESPSWLLISENHMEGWRAFVRPQGSAENTEQLLPVVPIFDNLQGIYLSAESLRNAYSDEAFNALTPEEQAALQNGQIGLRVVYSPQSFQLGLFGSFITVILAVFMVGVWLWRLFFAPQGEGDSDVARIARNSFVPIVLNLFNRAIDFGFAFIMLRILGPEDSGIYYYAGAIFMWFDILTNFGLDVFLTREVSRNPQEAGRYFVSTSALRFLLTVIGLGLLYAFLSTRQGLGESALSPDAIGAIVLLYIGLFPGSLSKGMTSLFYAFQQAEYPAAVATLSTINKTVFGVVALALGYGVIGLAGVSILTNVLTLAVLIYGGRKLIGQFVWPQVSLMRSMVSESWPLMLNHFLATIFFQIDVIIIEALRGPTMVGLYSVAYKWVSALNVIPAFFTQAMLPVMAQQAHDNREALRRNYILSIKLLWSVALPVAVVFTFSAYFLTEVLGGAQYVPHGAIATQLMIWSIPVGWMNSLTQYVLIALDLQRRTTWAFIIAVVFNITVNFLFIPEYGYQAAAITTTLSEILLFIPFVYLLQGAVGRLPWWGMLWRPGLSAVMMIVVMGITWPMQPILALGAGTVIYLAVLLVLRPFSADEIGRFAQLLPGRLRGWMLRLPTA